jgi:hypothetical protein
MAFNPLFMNNVSLLIDGDEVADAVSNVTLTPTSTALTFTGVSGTTTQSSGSTTWAASVTFAQDWQNVDSLSRTLFNRAGETVTIVFTPNSDEATDKVTVQATLVHGAIGGGVNATAETTVVLPISGKPVLTPIV